MNLTSAHIKNFRSLRDLYVEFTDTTVLLGENSSGKSSVLDAIKLALGRRWGSRGTGFMEYDFLMDPQNPDPKKSGGIHIELLFKESKPDEWHEDIVNDLTDVVQTDLNSDIDSVRLLTECKFDPLTNMFEPSWTFLGLDGNPLSKKSQRATNLSRFFDYVPVFSVSALRDAAQEFSPRSAFWGQLLRAVNVPEEQWKAIEAGLEELNTNVLKADEKLEGIRKKIAGLATIFAQDAANAVDIRALPLKAWDLIQRAEVIVKGRAESPWLPLGRHGHGVQSLSIIYLFQAFVEQALQNEYAKQAEPILLLEEPEAHLHPQAARLLGAELGRLAGQKLVTTHSPYFVERIPLAKIRIMRTAAEGARVYALRNEFAASIPMNAELKKVVDNTKDLLTYGELSQQLQVRGVLTKKLFQQLLACYVTQEDRDHYHPRLRRLKDESLSFVSQQLLDRLQDWARRTRGEIFFARLWFLVEGQAEYIIYSAVMEMLGYPLDRNGIAIIDYQNNGEPLAFVSLAKALGFRWVLSCDGDQAGNATVKRLKEDAECSADEMDNNVRQLHCKDLETLLVAEGMRQQVLAVAKIIDPNTADGISDGDLAKQMHEKTVEYAAALARMLLAKPIAENLLPKHIRDLKDRLLKKPSG